MSTSPNSTARPNAAPIKVVGLGLGRTGTMSLWGALEILGFCPAYHPMRSPTESADWEAWAEIIEGNDAPEAFDKILQGYHAVVDSPVAAKAEAVYAAYPAAKFILTTRDPAKWERSLRETVLKARRLVQENGLPEGMEGKSRWASTYFDVYHKGRLETHAKEEILEHNERIKKLIPSEQLLVYEIGEGWDRLVEFLGVPKPDIPFPHLNETVSYKEQSKALGVIGF